MEEIDFGINQQKLAEISNFYFLVYSTNLARGTVKVNVDGTIELILKRKQFFNIIESTCSLTIANMIDSTCGDHGQFYLFTRNTGVLKKLQNVSEIEKLTPQLIQQLKNKEEIEATNIFQKVIKENPLNQLTKSFVKNKVITQDNKAIIRTF